MRNRLLIVCLMFIAALVAARPAFAEETKAVKTMATMLQTLNHFPNAEQKATLKTLADDKTTTASELVLVNAITNMMHSITPADKVKVDALIADKATTPGVKSIAMILSKFLHMASDADKTELKKLSA
jgi:hypothetical protein